MSISKDFILHCQKKPEVFVSDVLGVTLEDYQKQILRTIVEHDRTAISACHDVGKSFTLATVVLWFMSCFPGAKVITTAPTFNQVKNILWSEIRAGYARSKIPLGGKMNMTEWQMTKKGDWFALGFTPRNELSGESGQGSQSSFQGFHAPHILVIFDEATGIPKNIWTMAEGILTSGNVKFVAIGNPTSRASEFYKCFSSPEWAKINLSCFDSPNLIANDIRDIDALTREIDYVRSLNDQEAQARLASYKVVKNYLLALKWVVAMGLPRKWGIDHPLFVSKVLGEFPADSDGTLIPLGVIEKAQLRNYDPKEGDRKVLGVDVARYGADSTVLTALHDRKYLARKQMLKKDAIEVTGACIEMDREHGPFDVIVVDETGVGGGVVDLLRNHYKESNTEIRGVQFGAAPECDGNDQCDHSECVKAKFVNMKARMFRLLADDLKAPDGLCLAQEDVYLDELPTILYHFDHKGRMVIESKDDYKKRTGRKSPDDADSLALANFGRYDEMSVGTFMTDSDLGFGRPFAAGLSGGKTW
jgi:phage terminase large subunit